MHYRSARLNFMRWYRLCTVASCIFTPPVYAVNDDWPIQVEEPAHGDLTLNKTIYAPQVSLPIVLSLFDKLEVSTPRIELSQISECKGVAELCRESYGVDIAASPLPGKTLVLSRQEISEIVKREWPLVAIEFDGAQATAITAVGYDLSEARVITELHELVSGAFAGEKKLQVEVVGIKMTQRIHVRSEDVKLNFPLFSKRDTEIMSAILNSGGSGLALDLNILPPPPLEIFAGYVSEEKPEKYTIRAFFTVKRLLPVLRVSLERGDIIREDQVEEQWMSGHTKSQSGLVTRTDQLVGRELKRSLTSGEPVFVSSIEVPVVMARGQNVNLVIQSGELRLTSKAQTMKPAGLGEQVEVIYGSARKHLTGRVVDSETVEIKM